MKRGPFHILLAEDDELHQQAAGCLLKKQGHRVVVAGNGRETVALLENLRFDFVLMDMKMPGMNGIQAARSIRSFDSKVLDRLIPIIALISLEEEDFREPCLRAGINTYIPKPLTVKALHEALDWAIRLSGWSAGSNRDENVSYR